ncbi:hypothetical protein ASF26_01780 [Methylobacterium sp. Leaf93]|nr:hypothetical protein ASF26_01780 [Methylobacterium sp. Leaf93]
MSGFPSPRARGEGHRHLVVPVTSGARVRGQLRVSLTRTSPLTFGYRLDALPNEGETRPSPRRRGEGMLTQGPHDARQAFALVLQRPADSAEPIDRSPLTAPRSTGARAASRAGRY